MDNIMDKLSHVLTTTDISFDDVFDNFMRAFGKDGNYDYAGRVALKGLNKTEKDLFHIYFDYREQLERGDI